MNSYHLVVRPFFMGVGIKEFKTRAKSYLETRNFYIRDDDYQNIQTETSIHGQEALLKPSSRLAIS